MQTSSPLLGLPGELRNWIFEYVLTSPRSLYYHSRPDATSSTTDTMLKPAMSVESLHFLTPDREFNQLKFVNKQLYAETAGLEIKSNVIAFRVQRLEGNPHKQAQSAEQAFLNLVTSMDDHKISWLAHVTIQSDELCSRGLKLKSPTPLLPSIIQFCKEHTQAKVRYEFNDWTWSTFPFFYFGVALMVALKRDEGAKALHDLYPNDAWQC